MSEELHFKRKTYIIPDQMVNTTQKYLEWIKKHALSDEDVVQLHLDFHLESPTSSEREILLAAASERKRLRKEGALKTLKTPHGDVDFLDHPLLNKGEK